MKTQIDCYGFEATSEHFQKRRLETFLVKNEEIQRTLRDT